MHQGLGKVEYEVEEMVINSYPLSQSHYWSDSF